MSAEVFAELFGAALTVLTCFCLGFTLLRYLQVPLHRAEVLLYSAVCGAALTSSVVFVLCALRIAYPVVFFVLAAASVGLARVARRQRDAVFPEEAAAVFGGWQHVVFLAIFALFAGSYVLLALAPEVSADGGTYHLGFVNRYAREHGFVPVYTNFYAGLPQGVELLYLFAFEFGRHSAAALVEAAYWLMLPWLVLAMFRRLHRTNAGVFAGLLIFTAPILAVVGNTAYVDAFLVTVLFAMFGLVEIWRGGAGTSTLVAAALLAGFAPAIKYTGYPAPLYLGVVVLAALWRRPALAAKRILLAGLVVSAVFGPWLVRNWMYYGNPVFPFANRIFPNPYVQPAFEDEYRKSMEQYHGVRTVGEIVWELTVRGGRLQGLLGPTFLLLPLGLLAVRWPAGRRLLLAGALFLLPYPENIGTRFFLPAALFFGSALAMSVVELGFPAMLLGCFAIYTAWPKNVASYGSADAVYLFRFPAGAILKPAKRAAYLAEQKGDSYVAARLLDRVAPPGSRVLVVGNLPDAYTNTEVVVSYQGTLNGRWISEMYDGAELRGQRLHNLSYAVLPGKWKRFRIVADGQVAAAPFKIRELTAFGSGRTLPLVSGSLTARPEPWFAGAAADGNPITAWSTEEPAHAGMYLGFAVSGTPDILKADIGSCDPAGWQLQAEDETGVWRRAAATATVQEHAPADHLEDAALSDLKAHGVQYIASEPQFPLLPTEPGELARWHVSLVARSRGYLIFKIL